MKAILAATGLAMVFAVPTVFAGGHEKGIDLSDLEWAKKISFKGDLRYRYQNDDASKSDERNRSRIRARIAAVAKPADNLEIGIGLASGSSDPVSSNQTLGGFGSSKDVNLDLAYFKYKYSDNLSVGGGKFKNTLYKPGKSQLQWDGDWRPEGLNASYENGIFFANGIVTWLEGDSRNVDLTMSILQGGVETELGGAKVTAGIGFTSASTEGQNCLFDEVVLTAPAGGGPVASAKVYDCGQNTEGMNAGTYATDFAVVDLFAEAALKVADMPVKVWAQYINNSDADAAPSGSKLDSGHQVGVQVGKAKKKGTWQGKIYYQDLDADATLAALTNSDFAGGGTDNKGIYIGGAYALSDKSTVNFSYFAAEDKNERSGAPAQDYDTLQLDIKFKF